LIQPAIQLGEEMGDGQGQGFTDDQGRPTRRRCCRTWVRTRAMLRA
jgi:hypothetical protein